MYQSQFWLAGFALFLDLDINFALFFFLSLNEIREVLDDLIKADMIT